MADDELHLAELLCARLCHDLAGPIGGAAAGVELIADETGVEAEDVQLLAASIATAAAHLKFLRAAFGHGSTAMSDAELRGLAAAFLPPGPHELDWRESGGGEWPRPWAKLALNLLIVARDSLPRGGRISIRLGRDPMGLTVTASGPTLAAEDMLTPLTAAAARDLTPRAAPAHYAARLAAAMGASIQTERAADRLVLTVTAP